jgi:hypothetical protein
MATSPGILIHESFHLDAVQVAMAMLVKERNVHVHKHHNMKAYEGGCRPGLYLHAFLTRSLDDGWSAGFLASGIERTVGTRLIDLVSPRALLIVASKGNTLTLTGIRFVAGVNC